MPHPAQLLGLARAIAWFAWPAWLLALWTLWQWRRRLSAQHVIVPLACAATLLGVWVAMAGSDRALMLALPALAILAAFALPTLQRGAAAAIDWFSVFFFTIAVATGWLFYAAMQTGMPAKLAANVARLSPGYSRDFSLLALRAGAGRNARLALARALAHRAKPASALEEPGAGGRRRQRLLAAGDDAAPAAARQRAQLSRDDAARRPRRPGRAPASPRPG